MCTGSALFIASMAASFSLASTFRPFSSASTLLPAALRSRAVASPRGRLQVRRLTYEAQAGGAVLENERDGGTTRVWRSSEIDVVILGGGPVGLATCAGLLTLEHTRKVTVVEKGPRDLEKDGPFSNMIGLGERAQNNLNAISVNIMENIKPDAVFPFGPSSVMTDRAGIRKGLYNALQNTQGERGAWSDRSELLFETSATAIDAVNKLVVLDNGRTVAYDVLVLADGIHSPSADMLGLPSMTARKYAHYDAFKILNLPPLPEPHNEPLRLHSFNTRHRTQAYFTDVYKRKIFFSLFPRKDGTYASILRFPLTDGKNPRGITTAHELKTLILSMSSSSNATLAHVYTPYLASVLTDEVLQACVDMEPRAFWSTKRKSIVDAEKGIVLVGDAAIGFPSALGVGTARGFEDTTLLVQSLRSALEQAVAGARSGAAEEDAGELRRRAIAAGLREYEPEVMRERRAMHDVTVLAMQANDTPWLFMPKQVMGPIIDAGTKYSSVKKHWPSRLWIWLARLTYTTRRVTSPAAARLRASYKKK
jgi:2-polyprenyl-6-methoxyphenol hydroxylase-like FAD-dependent oxidoreductase